MLGPETRRLKTQVALLSVCSNSLLIALKLVVGLSIGSVSVISEAIHSGMDLLAAALALFAVRKAHEPADDRHPYGHGKVENISGTVEALLIFIAAAWIIYEAIHKLMRPEPLVAPGWGVGVMAFSALANTFVSQMLFRVARKTDSVALEADAWHLRTDVWTSAGVALSLTAVWVGARFAPHANLHWLDPAAAILVALLILHAALRLTGQAARDLLDWALPSHEEQWIRDYLTGLKPTVSGFHHLRTRKSGSARFVDMHLLVDEDMHVYKAHDIAEEVSQAIHQHLPGSSVTVHIEPCAAKCDEDCLAGCLLTEEERNAVRLRHAHD
ncbi:MAG: cation transporter [Armatimonadetes bacterium]|nr:cation transporter [Armatimonadota bacterium]